MKNKELILGVNEIFHSIQGEGKYIGLNCMFLRLSGCNLSCGFCDTKHHSERIDMEVYAIQDEILNHKTDAIVITGGEPLLQQENLSELLFNLKMAGKKIIIETNGTIVPDKKLALFIDHFSVSPKLASSNNDLDRRVNYDALYYFNDHENSIFKFVIKDGKDLSEVLFLQDQIKIESSKIYLMKEGARAIDQNQNIDELIQICINNGYNYSPRLHVLIWDGKRGV